ncbi:transporter substrate-binding domain-containing protein [Agrococcus casei]|uniref:ABC-type polar amino acid transport system protein, substrate-binding protein n=1 Tax=Agrococcus casei LMG 22410 TaxID=1255656 RepID=A0A1R4ERP3_9MICO|nr:transporter substrate-binding domain-containing protein [Agrococcus casei]SJM46357.1 ABC-type polar amino acid transport system protein, substrate-binding protein [Agrococcus casei LMG 22410]
MKKNKTLLAFGAIGALLLTSCASGGDAEQSGDATGDDATQTVIFSTGTQFPPMGYVEGGDLIGFDIDLGNALAERAGVEVEWAESEFSQFLADVNSGRSNAVLGAMLDTPERQETLTWVDYLESGFQFFTMKDTADEHGISGIEDLCGLTVAASRNSTYAGSINDWSAENCDGDDITVLDTDGSPDALLQLRQGRAQAVMQTSEAIAYIASQDEKIMPVGDPITSAFYGIGFPKGDPMVEQFQTALEELIADGTYAEIAAEWGLDAQTVDQVTINLEGL